MGLFDKFKSSVAIPDSDANIRKVAGGILTGIEIDRQVQAGGIYISPYDRNQLNPNSYNVRCGDKALVYDTITMIDLKDPDTYKKTIELEITEDDGLILRPGIQYLIPTKEVIGSDYYVPMITGRSSMGRLGIRIHEEAGFGDIGFKGHLTMQMKVTYPTIIYPGRLMGQVYFMTPVGDIKWYYNGNYAKGAISSQYKDSK